MNHPYPSRCIWALQYKNLKALLPGVRTHSSKRRFGSRGIVLTPNKLFHVTEVEKESWEERSLLFLFVTSGRAIPRGLFPMTSFNGEHTSCGPYSCHKQPEKSFTSETDIPLEKQHIQRRSAFDKDQQKRIHCWKLSGNSTVSFKYQLCLWCFLLIIYKTDTNEMYSKSLEA